MVVDLWVIHRRGRQKFRRSHDHLLSPQAFADPRLACAVAENCPDLVASDSFPRSVSLIAETPPPPTVLAPRNVQTIR